VPQEGEPVVPCGATEQVPKAPGWLQVSQPLAQAVSQQ
jgi:hypothetical protein